MSRAFFFIMKCFLLFYVVTSAAAMDFSEQQRSRTLQSLINEANKAHKSSFNISQWESYMGFIENIKDMHEWSSNERRQLLYVIGLVPKQLLSKHVHLGNKLINGVTLSDTIELRLIVELIKSEKIKGLDSPDVYLALLADPFLANLRSDCFRYFMASEAVVSAYLKYCMDIGISKWTDADVRNLSLINLSRDFYEYTSQQIILLLDRQSISDVVIDVLHVLVRSEKVAMLDEALVQSLLQSTDPNLANLGYGIVLFDNRLVNYRTRKSYMSLLRKFPPHISSRGLRVAPYLVLGAYYIEDLEEEDLHVLMRSSDSLMSMVCVLRMWGSGASISDIEAGLHAKSKSLQQLCAHFGLDSLIYKDEYTSFSTSRPIKRSLEIALHNLERAKLTAKQRTELLIKALDSHSIVDREYLLAQLIIDSNAFEFSKEFTNVLYQMVYEGSQAAVFALRALSVDEVIIQKRLLAALWSERSLYAEDAFILEMLKQNRNKQSVDVLLHRSQLAKPANEFYVWMASVLRASIDSNIHSAFPGYRNVRFREDLAASLRLLHGECSMFTPYIEHFSAPDVLLLWNRRDGVRNILQILSLARNR